MSDRFINLFQCYSGHYLSNTTTYHWLSLPWSVLQHPLLLKFIYVIPFFSDPSAKLPFFTFILLNPLIQ